MPGSQDWAFFCLQAMHYQFEALSHVGRIRANNEDSLAFDPPTGIAVLADGMGGYKAGEVASSMATSLITAMLRSWLIDAGSAATQQDTCDAMARCVESANLAIFDAAHANPDYAGMGTTLVLCALQGNRILVGHVGDSRCYRIRGRILQRLTKDHSLLQQHLDAGRITPELAALSPIKNLVTRALGVELGVRLEIKDYSVEPGDVYLMCSDGLTDMVTDEQIVRIATRGESLGQVAAQLVAAANDNGGKDNVSVLLIAAGSPAFPKGFLARLLGQ